MQAAESLTGRSGGVGGERVRSDGARQISAAELGPRADGPPACQAAGQLHRGGVFALWSNEPPEPDFLGAMETVFQCASAHVVEFWNASQDRTASNTIYLGRTAG